MNKYYMLEKTEHEATINIFGDITSFPWCESDVSNYNLSKQLAELQDVDKINVHISSYGGEVAEGLAIYNALRNHKAKVTTVCDGFACSIASVIFMAGDERIMNEASLLMIHNAWTFAEGNAAALRKQADDLDIITQASVEAYKAHSSLSEEEIKALMDAETWILPEDALEYGFATSVIKTEKEKASQNAFMQLLNIIKAYQEEENPDEETEDEESTNDDSENPEGENPEENPDEPETEENPEEETDSDESEEENSEDETEEQNQENTTQKWSGFFNAILKI